MLIPCPSCGQNNPPNAKQCLHCNHQLPVPAPKRFDLDHMATSISDAGASNSPKYQIAGVIVLLLFAAVFIYVMMNGTEQICLDRSDTQRRAELESQGYSCHRDLFVTDHVKQQRKERARPGGSNRRILDICCTPPKEEKPRR